MVFLVYSILPECYWLMFFPEMPKRKGKKIIFLLTNFLVVKNKSLFIVLFLRKHLPKTDIHRLGPFCFVNHFLLSILCRSPAKMDLYLESYDGPSGVHLRDNLPHCNIQKGQNVLFIFIFYCHKLNQKK